MKTSVAICTYNGEKYIEEQLISILNQSIKPDEIVICDDNSTDNTIQLAEKILITSSIKFRIETNQTNLGVIKNFEKAIGLTSGDIIFLSDQDDIWLTNKIKTILYEFSKDPDCVLAFTDADLVNYKRGKLGVKLWETLKYSHNESDKNSFHNILLNRCVVTGATMAIKRELFNNVKPFKESWIHDGWLAINAPLYGTVKAIKAPLIEYRQHENNVIGATSLKFIERVKKYYQNIGILEKVRRDRYSRYKTFYDFNYSKLDDDMKIKIKECIEFWSDMKRIESFGLTKGLLTIFKNIINGNYKKYYTGLRGACRDLLYIVIKTPA